MNGNGCERKRSMPISKYIPGIVWRDRVKPQIISVRRIAVPAEIQTPTGLSQR